MVHATDVGLALLSLVWWVAVVWYAWRLFVPRKEFPRVKRTIHSWHLLVMGTVIASLATEELVMQRIYGGWDGHGDFIGLVVTVVIVLGVDRLHTLYVTRPERYDARVVPAEADAP